jgi:hypothetical protein
VRRGSRKGGRRDTMRYRSESRERRQGGRRIEEERGMSEERDEVRKRE